MFDRREAILLQLLADLQAIPGLASTWRDRGELQEFDADSRSAVLPAAILLDGKEKFVGKTTTSGHGIRPGPLPPTQMCLYPQVFVALMPRPNNQNVGVGAELSSWRMLVLSQLYNDLTLRALLGSSGDIQYLGSDTDMQEGGFMIGQILIHLALTYVFDPKDLV